MNKQIRKIVLASSAVLFILTAGCQPTPDTFTVIGKDQSIMLEQATGEDSDNLPLSEIKTSERYSAELSNEKGNITVSVDTEITYPEVDKIPIVEIAEGDMSDDVARSVISVFLRGEKLYTRTGDIEISELTKKIQWLTDIKNGTAPRPDNPAKDPGSVEDIQCSILGISWYS